MEDFKRVYPEEFGILIGRSYSPGLFTLRRFLHKARELDKSEKLIDEFGITYLKSGIAKGTTKNNLAELAPRFMLDLFDLKSQKLME